MSYRRNLHLLAASPCYHTYCLGLQVAVVEQLDLTLAYHWSHIVIETSFASTKDSLVGCFAILSLSMSSDGEAAGSDSGRSSYCTWQRVCNLSFFWQLHAASHHLTCTTGSSTCLLGSLESHVSVLSSNASYSSPFSLLCYWTRQWLGL